MRLLCLHEDTVQALQRLGTAVDDLTPRGLWNTPYHLVSMSPEQRDALQRLRVSMDDITPTALRDGGGVAATAGASQASVGAAARGAGATTTTGAASAAGSVAAASQGAAQAVPSPT